ncbi:nuclear transport factor 2 family protein [Nocardioides sp. B-3]|uniref:nuclear transport factor 2 family protein n=1 Tax=Nocardioides sp. B-3 TaxID=2895565 RepID=UPI003FA52556
MTHGDDLRRLLDLEEIRQLKYAYFRCVDTKDWPGVAACFVPEATAAYPTRECADRDAIPEFLTSSLVPDLITMHHGHHPEIHVDGDEATGTWHLHDPSLRTRPRLRARGRRALLRPLRPHARRLADVAHRLRADLREDAHPGRRHDPAGRPFPRRKQLGPAAHAIDQVGRGDVFGAWHEAKQPSGDGGSVDVRRP